MPKNNKKKKKEKEVTLENYNPLNDYLFYKYICEKGNELQQKTFFEAIEIEIKGKIKVQNKAIAPELINKKECVLDYLGETEDSLINIELQQFKTSDFNNRLAYYSSKLTRLEKGRNYDMFKNVIIVSIVNFKINDSQKYKHEYKIINTEDLNDIFTEKVKIIIIELEKFREIEKDLKNKEHLYLKFFDKNTNHEERKEMAKMDEGLKTAVKRIEGAIQNENELWIYHKVQYEKLAAEKEKIKTKEKIKQVKQKERKIGEEKGIKIGEEKSKVKIAIKLKNEGIPLEIIAKTTGITITKIKKL